MLKHSDGKPAFSGLMPGKDGKLPKMEMGAKPDDKPMESPSGDDHSELHDNKDGTFSVVIKGVMSDPMSLEEATEALKAAHGGGESSTADPSQEHDHEGLTGFGG